MKKAMISKNLIGLFMVGVLSACGTNFGNNNAGFNQTNPNLFGPGGYNGCAPLTGQLGFNIQGGSINATTLVGGNLPITSARAGQYGQVLMNSFGGAFGGNMNSLSKSSANGNMMIQISAADANFQNIVLQHPATQVMAQGMLQLSPTVIQTLQFQAGYSLSPFGGQNFGGVSPFNGFGTPFGAAGCITSIGVDIVGTWQPAFGAPQGGVSVSGFINQALLFLYLNNSATPTPIIL